MTNVIISQHWQWRKEKNKESCHINKFCIRSPSNKQHRFQVVDWNLPRTHLTKHDIVLPWWKFAFRLGYAFCHPTLRAPRSRLPYMPIQDGGLVRYCSSVQGLVPASYLQPRESGALISLRENLLTVARRGVFHHGQRPSFITSNASSLVTQHGLRTMAKGVNLEYGRKIMWIPESEKRWYGRARVLYLFLQKRIVTYLTHQHLTQYQKSDNNPLRSSIEYNKQVLMTCPLNLESWLLPYCRTIIILIIWFQFVYNSLGGSLITYYGKHMNLSGSGVFAPLPPI